MDQESSASRGQSEIIGVSILLVIVILGSIIIGLTGVQAINDDKKTVAVSHAEKSLRQLDSRTSDVILGIDGSASQVVNLRSMGDAGLYKTQRGSWIRVRILDPSTGAIEAEVANETMGSVVYQRDRTAIAYEGGGVWRMDDGGTVMLSPPEFHFQDGTLTLPVVSASGDSGLDGHVKVTRNGMPERKFPNSSAGLTNRLKNGKVVVTIHSDYYRAWGKFFDRSSNAYVWYNHTAEQVNAVFLVLPGWGSLRSGIIATSGAGELSLVGTGAYVDSYNSTIGNYSSTQSSNGTVEANGDVITSGNSEIAGDVRSGDRVEVGTSSIIDGDVYWTNGYVEDGTVTGINTTITGVASVEPIDGFVELSVDMVQAGNDNGGTPHIVNNKLQISGSSAELGAGSYYLENLNLQGENLVLNTSDGDIYIGVRDWMKLERSGGTGSNITVKGDGIVRIFLLNEDKTTVSITGQGNRDVNLHVGKESSISIPGDRSPQLRLYSTQTLQGTIAGSNSAHATFTGVIYAPAGKTGPGSVFVKQADVYGQILTGNLTIGQYGSVHYDRGLQGIPLPRSPTVARLEFMHVAVHHARLEDL